MSGDEKWARWGEKDDRSARRLLLLFASLLYRLCFLHDAVRGWNKSTIVSFTMGNDSKWNRLLEAASLQLGYWTMGQQGKEVILL
jgi:hypothetical protein